MADEGSYNAVAFRYSADYYDPSQPTEEEDKDKGGRTHKHAHKLEFAENIQRIHALSGQGETLARRRDEFCHGPRRSNECKPRRRLDITI